MTHELEPNYLAEVVKSVIWSFPGVYSKNSIWKHTPRPKKPRYTPAMKAKCLQFANSHQHWTAQQYRKVLFFPTNQPSNSLWFERGTSVDHLKTFWWQMHHINSETPSKLDDLGGGAMPKNSVAALSFLPPRTTMNGQKYVKIHSENAPFPLSGIAFLCIWNKFFSTFALNLNIVFLVKTLQ